MKNLIFILTILLVSCEKPDLSSISSYSRNKELQAMISIPAGSSKIYKYNSKERAFEIFKENGLPKKNEFLAAPFNVGFIPSSKSFGDYPLEVIVVAENYEFSELIEITPIACLQFDDNGSIRNYVLAQPVDKQEIIINLVGTNIESDQLKNVMNIIKIWLESYENKGNVKLLKYIGKEETKKIIKSSLIN